MAWFRGGVRVDRAPADLVEFCAREWPRLVGSLTLYVGDPAAGEDLAQETLVRVARHWPRVRHLDSPGGWAYRVSMNLAVSHFRRQRSARRANARAPHSSGVHVDDDVAGAVAIRAAVAELPDRQRRVIVLRYFADLSVREVADVLQVPESTVKTLTRAGLETLRAAGLSDVGEDEREPNDVG